MTLADPSWTKPTGIPNLIGRKQCDWSLLHEGTCIPQEYQPFFAEANGGVLPIEQPSSMPVSLVFEGEAYKANLYRHPLGRLHLRYSDRRLAGLLRERLHLSYEYISKVRSTVLRGNKVIVVPAHLAEYLDFYSTREHGVYILSSLPRRRAGSLF